MSHLQHPTPQESWERLEPLRQINAELLDALRQAAAALAVLGNDTRDLVGGASNFAHASFRAAKTIIAKAETL